MPPLANSSLEVERPRTAHEYGLSAARQALKLRFREGRKSPYSRAIGAPSVSETDHLRLTFPWSRSLYTASRRAVRLRRDCAPLKLLTGIVNRYPIVLGCTGFDGSPVIGGWGPPWSPGCLKSELEERETWTAGSLRVASRGEAILQEGRLWKRLRRTRLRYIADFWIFERELEGAIDQWVDLVNVTTLPSVVTAQT